MSRRSGRVARGLTAALVVGAVTGVAVLGSQDAVPALATADPSVVRVPAAARTLVCPGPLALPAQDVAGDAAFDPTPAPTVTTQRLVAIAGDDPTGDATGAPVGAATLSPLAGGEPLVAPEAGAEAEDVVVGDAVDVLTATVLRAEPTGGEAATVAGASASVTAQGDLRGLAAASCRPPSASTWLVGGSTEIGSSALLVVANPGRTPAEVSVRVIGPTGPVETPGATFLVAPGAERGLLLEGVAAEQRRVAVEVTASGGLVSAHLQDSRLDGFTPAGTDLVTAGAAPSTRQVLGALVVPASAVGAADAAQVRLLATGEDRATASLTLLGPTGPVTLAGAERIDLGPGEVTDVSLAGLPAGAYTAVVDADGPVVAGAMLTRQGPPIELGDVPTLERAWVAATETGAGGLVAVPDGVAATVVVGAVAGPEASDAAGGTAGADAAEGTLVLLGDDGAVLAERPVSVPAGSSVRVDPAALAGGRPVVAIRLVPDDAPVRPAAGSGAEGSATGESTDDAGPTLAWAVLATVGTGPDELLSVLVPVPRPEAQPSVRVREGARLGLP